MKQLLIWLLVLCASAAFSQDYLAAFEFKTQDDEEMFSLYDEDSEILSILATQDKELLIYHFDKNFEQINSHTTEKPDKYNKNLMGALVSGDSLVVYYSNKNFTGLSSLFVNTSTNEVIPTIHPLKIKNQRYLASEMVDDILYVVSIENYKSILKLYKLRVNQSIEVFEFDLGDYKFLDDRYENSFDHLLNTSTSNIQKISDETPNSIGFVSSENKIYFHDDFIYITSDFYQLSTKVITLDLKRIEYDIKDIPQPEIANHKTIPGNSNSRIYKGNIFQIKASANELAVVVKDFKSGELLIEYRLTQEDSLALNNTEIIQKGNAQGFAKSERELDKTKQVIRKLARSDIGIDCFERKDFYEILIGGIIEVVNPPVGAVMAVGPGGASFGIGIPLHSYYPVSAYSYNNYVNSKSIQFSSAIQKDSFERINNRIEPNIFEKVTKSLDESINRFFVELIFKLKDHYYMVYYFKPEKKHHLIRID